VTARIVDKGGGIGRMGWWLNDAVLQIDFGAGGLNREGEVTNSFELCQDKVRDYSKAMKSCPVVRQQEYYKTPKVLLGENNYAVVPRYLAVLEQLNTGAAEISRTPTYVVIAAADLMASAARGGGAKRQLEVGTAVTLIKTEGEWAYVAKDGTVLGYVLQRQLAPLH
jgi:hypothetical protein